MKPDPRFLSQPKHFWANVRTISQHVGYTERGTEQVKAPSWEQMARALSEAGLKTEHIVGPGGTPTALGRTLMAYFRHRADALNGFVEPRLMDMAEAKRLFERIRAKTKPKCPIPMNKQKGKWKCGRSYLCRILDMLHMGFVDEALFGREVVERLPTIVRDWVALARKRSVSGP